MEKIKVYINGDIITTDFLNKEINLIFFDSLKYMYEKYPHLLEFFIFTKNEETLKEKLQEFNYSFIKKEDLPKDINKMHHLIDNDYDFLCEWERRTGKGITYNLKHSSKEQWLGFKLTSQMTKEEFIQTFQKTMHLYN
ncbi:hypothetical protein [Thomasclavelia cocleata]|uniref:hypothetical protein n=1 Tax=Thomasclavelia cocleata TaxID=69824 RepID=UPI00256F3F83|nr:hypothetical protein [Thomasclavelia cocleata]